MNKLYYVACYSPHLNEWQRYLVTADGSEEAGKMCEFSDWEARRILYVCETYEDVGLEL